MMDNEKFHGQISSKKRKTKDLKEPNTLVEQS